MNSTEKLIFSDKITTLKNATGIQGANNVYLVALIHVLINKKIITDEEILNEASSEVKKYMDDVVEEFKKFDN